MAEWTGGWDGGRLNDGEGGDGDGNADAMARQQKRVSERDADTTTAAATVGGDGGIFRHDGGIAEEEDGARRGRRRRRQRRLGSSLPDSIWGEKEGGRYRGEHWVGEQRSRMEEGKGGGSEGLKRTDRRRRRIEEMKEMAVVMKRERYDNGMPPCITAVTTVGEFCFKWCGM